MATLVDTTREDRRLDASALFGSGSEHDPEFDHLASFAAKLLRAPLTVISLVDERRHLLKSQFGLPEHWGSVQEVSLTHSVCKHVVANREPLVISDARLDPLVRDNPVIAELGVLSYAGVPLTVDGEALGALCAMDHVPRNWIDRELGILIDVAHFAEARLELALAKVAASRRGALLSAMMNSMEDAVIACDERGKLLSWNRAASGMLGPAQELPPSAWSAIYQLYRPDGSPYPPACLPLSRAMRGESVRNELLLVRAPESAEGRWHRINASPLIDAAGRQIGAITLGRDVTQQEEMHRMLHRQNELLTTINTHLPGGAVFVFDQDLRFARAEGPALASMNLNSSECVGRCLHEIAGAETLRPLEELFRATLVGQSGETQLVRGSRVLLVRTAPIPDTRVGVSTQFGSLGVALVFDITEHHREASDLRHAKGQLEDQARQLREQSMTDTLTGLHNRRGFTSLAEQALKEAQRSGVRLMLFYVDVNGMKQINDRLGHGAGDQALIETAALLRGTFREADVIARLGGDEFVVLAADVPQGSASALTERLAANLAEGNQARHAANFRLSLSVGQAAYDPKLPISIDQLLAKSDAAMYAQKRGLLPPGAAREPHKPRRLDLRLRPRARYGGTARK